MLVLALALVVIVVLVVVVVAVSIEYSKLSYSQENCSVSAFVLSAPLGAIVLRAPGSPRLHPAPLDS